MTEKTQLHELLQKKGFPPPFYEVKEKGADHSKDFQSTILFLGESFVSDWKKNKKEAQNHSAKLALDHYLKSHPNGLPTKKDNRRRPGSIPSNQQQQHQQQQHHQQLIPPPLPPPQTSTPALMPPMHPDRLERLQNDQLIASNFTSNNMDLMLPPPNQHLSPSHNSANSGILPLPTPMNISNTMSNSNNNSSNTSGGSLYSSASYPTPTEKSPLNKTSANSSSGSNSKSSTSTTSTTTTTNTSKQNITPDKFTNQNIYDNSYSKLKDEFEQYKRSSETETTTLQKKLKLLVDSHQKLEQLVFEIRDKLSDQTQQYLTPMKFQPFVKKPLPQDMFDLSSLSNYNSSSSNSSSSNLLLSNQSQNNQNQFNYTNIQQNNNNTPIAMDISCDKVVDKMVNNVNAITSINAADIKDGIINNGDIYKDVLTPNKVVNEYHNSICSATPGTNVVEAVNKFREFKLIELSTLINEEIELQVYRVIYSGIYRAKEFKHLDKTYLFQGYCLYTSTLIPLKPILHIVNRNNEHFGVSLKFNQVIRVKKSEFQILLTFNRVLFQDILSQRYMNHLDPENYLLIPDVKCISSPGQTIYQNLVDLLKYEELDVIKLNKLYKESTDDFRAFLDDKFTDKVLVTNFGDFTICKKVDHSRVVKTQTMGAQVIPLDLNYPPLQCLHAAAKLKQNYWLLKAVLYFDQNGQFEDTSQWNQLSSTQDNDSFQKKSKYEKDIFDLNDGTVNRKKQKTYNQNNSENNSDISSSSINTTSITEDNTNNLNNDSENNNNTMVNDNNNEGEEEDDNDGEINFDDFIKQSKYYDKDIHYCKITGITAQMHAIAKSTLITLYAETKWCQDLYNFKQKSQINLTNPRLIREVFTHPSTKPKGAKINVIEEMSHDTYRPFTGDNQRLEFLGDSVLKFTSSLYLYFRNRDMREGELSNIRSFHTNNSYLMDISKKIRLDEVLRLNYFGNTKKPHADVMESLFGAYYLEHGISQVYTFVVDHIFSSSADCSHYGTGLLEMPRYKCDHSSHTGLDPSIDEFQYRMLIYLDCPYLLVDAFQLYHTTQLNQPAIQMQNEDIKNNNQRLEFLGDSVIDVIVTDFLFRAFPKQQEGFLTEHRSMLVKNENFARLTRTLDIPPNLDSFTRDQLSTKKLGDYFETLIGCLFLDKGFEFVKSFIYKHLNLSRDNIINAYGLDDDGYKIFDDDLPTIQYLPSNTNMTFTDDNLLESQ
ncbi:putative RNase III [Tieghemostelium lacteum]|uniref:Putative RNase III n=1 Tax=Tieghemostelium lacteum TaxID=361077 RepID=A0A152A857_TIELA|nr:putative RNase III [Tieghemostelium lacteum]|eukprot:KYR02227.1 putative RNase III [Tieghemostelium lacteum]